MRTYEVTFIVDPVLATDDIKATADNYVEHLKSENCVIIDLQQMGLRQLAYPINKRSTGVYYSLEFQSENGEIVKKLELALKRDERVIRHMLIKLEKFGVKYNDDKRNGRIVRRTEPVEAKEEVVVKQRIVKDRREQVVVPVIKEEEE